MKIIILNTHTHTVHKIERKSTENANQNLAKKKKKHTKIL